MGDVINISTGNVVTETPTEYELAASAVIGQDILCDDDPMNSAKAADLETTRALAALFARLRKSE